MASRDLPDRVADLTRILLDPGRDATTLRPEVVDLASCLVAASGHVADARIERGESRTSEGLALSPSMAAMCIDDYVRTVVFLRGVHAAVLDRAEDAPVRLLYVGCGPLGTLVAPLLTVIDPAAWSCRWVDIHEASVQGARRVAAALDPGGAVEDVARRDGFDLRIEEDRRPDVVVMEILQAVLEHEPQVALTQHVLGQAPEATLVPERIEIALEWIDVTRRFEGDADASCIPLGTAFALDRATARVGEDGWIEGATLALPDPLPSVGRPMLSTRIRTYGPHVLDTMQSGLTVPRPLVLDAPWGAGTSIRFRYRAGDSPALEAFATS